MLGPQEAALILTTIIVLIVGTTIRNKIVAYKDKDGNYTTGKRDGRPRS